MFFSLSSREPQSKALTIQPTLPAETQCRSHIEALQFQVADMHDDLQRMHMRVQAAERQGRRSFAGLKRPQSASYASNPGMCNITSTQVPTAHLMGAIELISFIV